MQAIMYRESFRKLTIIFAFSYALAGLLLFIDLFFLFMLGHSVRFEEPNKIVAAVEFASAILSALILLLLLMQQLGGEGKMAREQEIPAENKAIATG